MSDQRASPGTVTFLFTDIEGSTRLVAQLRAAYADVLEQHRTILREAAARHDGEEVDTQGDAFFFSFHRAQDAVLAAAEAQRALTAHSWPGGAQVRVRMGIHTGEPGRSVSGYHGLGVVRAARISAAGHGGQVLISQVTRSLVEDEELPGIEFKTLGEHRLKDIERPEHLSQLVIDGLPSEFPPPRGLESQTVKEEFVAPHKRRLRLVAALAVAVAVVAAIAVYAATRGGTAAPALASPNSVAAIDPATNRVTADLTVGDRPTRIAAGNGFVWALNEGARTVSQISPTDRSVRTFAIGRTPDDIAVGDGKLWVGEPTTGVLDEIDPETGTTLRQLRPRLPKGVVPYNTPQSRYLDAGSVAFGEGEVWFASGNGTVARINAKTLRVNAVITGVDTANDGEIIALPHAVWLTDDYGTITHIDPQSNGVLGRVRITHHDTGGLAITPDGAVWATDLTQNSLWEIDGTNDSLVTSFPVGSNPVGIAYGAGSLWIANSGDGTVTRLDPRSGRATTIRVGGSPLRVVFANGLVWVTVD